MPTAFINGANIHYEVMGDGPPVALTTGGRLPGRILLPLARLMALRCRVLIYDRRNTGSSDISIAGEGSESDLCLEDLRGLTGLLDMRPAYVGGSSFGCGISLLLAIRHPDDVKRLLLFQPGGGSAGATSMINQRLYGEFIDVARKGGMTAVAETPYFSTLIDERPDNRARLMSIEPDAFISVMMRWRSLNIDGAPTFVAPGATENQIRKISVRTVIVSGDDEAHSPEQAEKLHRLITTSELAPFRFPVNPTTEHREKLAQIFTDFIANTESR